MIASAAKERTYQAILRIINQDVDNGKFETEFMDIPEDILDRFKSLGYTIYTYRSKGLRDKYKIQWK